jgi:hypothetical protein
MISICCFLFYQNSKLQDHATYLKYFRFISAIYLGLRADITILVGNLNSKSELKDATEPLAQIQYRLFAVILNFENSTLLGPSQKILI